VTHNWEREIVRRVIELWDEEVQNICLRVPMQKGTERAAYYIIVSQVTIMRIRKIRKEKPNDPQRTPVFL
jgi:hypothetical protein